MDGKKYSCVCKADFPTKYQLLRHRKICNTALKNVKEGSFLCAEHSCVFRCKIGKEFLEHLKNVHNISTEEITKRFQSYSEFKHWKSEYENSSTVLFRLKRARKVSSGTIEYYICNRSGKYVSKSMGKRALKSQGSRKIGSNCPASIKVTLSNTKSKVIAEIIDTHYGHEKKLAHIPIPKEEKKDIAAQLSQGITPERVLSNLYSEDVVEVKRKHLISKKDILNISKSFGINTKQKQSSDCVSSDAYDKDTLEGNKDILLYKRQGEDAFYFPKGEPCTLRKEDFALAIMTNFQKKMLEQFGNKIICMDATHDVTKYGYCLITVLVIDEFEEGVPVAWLISNGEPHVVLSLFLKHLKENVEISPKYFMSGIAPLFYYIFSQVFCCEPRKLLCHRLVHKNWIKNLSKVKDKKQASIVYKTLCVLMEESDEEKFEELLLTFYESLMEDGSTQDFGFYVRNEWVQNKKEWAKCYRIHSGITCNMFVESFHKTLKHHESYMKEKEGKQVDKCLNNLLNFSLDCARKRLIKLENGKSTWKAVLIQKRHRAALSTKNLSIKRSSDSIWEVKSESSDNTFYIVKKHPLCNKNCALKCKDCNICLHSFSCSCPDGLTGINICKHVHFIVLNTPILISPNSFSFRIDEDSSKNSTSDVFSPQFLLKSSTYNHGDLSNIKRNMEEKCLQALNLIKDCDNKNSLIIARNYLNDVILALTLDINLQGVNESKAKKAAHDKKLTSSGSFQHKVSKERNPLNTKS